MVHAIRTELTAGDGKPAGHIVNYLGVVTRMTEPELTEKMPFWPLLDAVPLLIFISLGVPAALAIAT